MQPMIMYLIRATLAGVSDHARTARKCHIVREILIVPSIQAAPHSQY